MSYFLSNKRIPDQLPDDLLEQHSIPPKCFIPSEQLCPFCRGNLTVLKEKKVAIFGYIDICKGMYFFRTH